MTSPCKYYVVLCEVSKLVGFLCFAKKQFIALYSNCNQLLIKFSIQISTFVLCLFEFSYILFTRIFVCAWYYRHDLRLR